MVEDFNFLLLLLMAYCKTCWFLLTTWKFQAIKANTIKNSNICKTLLRLLEGAFYDLIGS